jgi:hypothetical protein
MITAIVLAVFALASAPPTTDECPVPGVAEPVTTIPGNGTWLVGTDIAPGIYRTDASGDGLCQWRRLSGLSGTNDDIVDIGDADGPSYFEVFDTDLAVEIVGSGECVWTLTDIET